MVEEIYDIGEQVIDGEKMIAKREKQFIYHSLSTGNVIFPVFLQHSQDSLKTLHPKLECKIHFIPKYDDLSMSSASNRTNTGSSENAL